MVKHIPMTFLWHSSSDVVQKYLWRRLDCHAYFFHTAAFMFCQASEKPSWHIRAGCWARPWCQVTADVSPMAAPFVKSPLCPWKSSRNGTTAPKHPVPCFLPSSLFLTLVLPPGPMEQTCEHFAQVPGKALRCWLVQPVVRGSLVAFCF